MTHLRFAAAPEAELRVELIRIIRGNAALMRVFETAREMGLPDWWIVSGAIYNAVGNALTVRPEGYGVKDIDLF